MRKKKTHRNKMLNDIEAEKKSQIKCSDINRIDFIRIFAIFFFSSLLAMALIYCIEHKNDMNIHTR